MRTIIPLILMLTACSRESEPSSLATGEFAGNGRDRLCISGEPGAYRAGLIAYGNGDVNCSAAGRLESVAANWVLVPRGEGDCRIPLQMQGNSVRLGDVPGACSYYCGPGASLAGKSFNRSDMGAKAVDFAGDPLC